MVDIKSLYPDELKEFVLGLGEPAFRGAQLFSWLHEKQVRDFSEMTNLSLKLRERLKEEAFLTTLSPVRRQEAEDGTVKYLLRAGDGCLLEAVVMKHPYGLSACISSQVGCRMGCSFCASGLKGLQRNLSASELLEEVYFLERELKEERLSHVVVMGMGEPLENYDALVRFLRLVGDPKGRDFSLRNITVSTCGLAPEILKLAGEGLPITLALSLHAPTQEKRETLMPIARRYALSEVIPAVEEYFARTGRRVTLEYVLIRGGNDAPEDARSLSALVKGMKGSPHVNLIPLNPVAETGLEASDGRAFQMALEKNGINVTIRKEHGRNIDSACGQLRYRVME